MMIDKIIILLSTVIISNVYCRSPSKIIGGINADILNFPSVVALENGLTWQTCGATLISTKHVLTAAHCVIYGIHTGDFHMIDLMFYNIVSGDANRNNFDHLQVHKVVRVDVHKSFVAHPNSIIGDIAVLTLEEDITVGPTRRPASLPAVDNLKAGDRGTMLGWGWTEEKDSSSVKELQVAWMTVQDRYTESQCEQYNPWDPIICGMEKPGVAFCNGDSGGPLFYNGELVGIISNSIDCSGKTPGIFTKVYPFKHWIEQVMKGDNSTFLSAKIPISNSFRTTPFTQLSRLDPSQWHKL